MMQCHGDGENEPMEYLHWPSCTFRCRKVIMHECPHINDLSIAKLLKLNLGCSGIVTGKLNQQKICISHSALLSAERSSHMNFCT